MYKEFGYNKWVKYKTSRTFMPDEKVSKKSYPQLWKPQSYDKKSYPVTWKDSKKFQREEMTGLEVSRAINKNSKIVCVRVQCSMFNTRTVYPAFKIRAYSKINGKKVLVLFQMFLNLIVVIKIFI